MNLQSKHRAAADNPGRIHSLVGRIVTMVVLLGATTGCMALRLALRGAPEAEIRQFQLRLDAVDLPVNSEGGHQHQRRLAPLWTTTPVSGWLHGFDYRLIDAEGDPVPSEVLHHLKVMAPNHRELFSSQILHLVGAGQETSPVSLPRQIGYRLEEGDSLLVSAMLHNTTAHSLAGVRLEISLEYSPVGSWRPPLAVVPFFTQVTPPLQETFYDLPPGYSQTSVLVKPAISGRILALGGHLHRYGVSLRLEDVGSRRVLWEVEADRLPDGTVVGIPQDEFIWSRGPKLRAERTYRVTATYDNPTGHSIPDGGMGTLGGVIVPDEPWPTVDRKSAEYVWELDRETGLAEVSPHEHR